MPFWLNLPLGYNYATLEIFTIHYIFYCASPLTAGCGIRNFIKANCVFHPPWCFLPSRAIWPRKSQALDLGLSWLARALSQGSRDLCGVELFHEQHSSLWKPTQQILSGSCNMLTITINLEYIRLCWISPGLKSSTRLRHRYTYAYVSTHVAIHTQTHICTHTCRHIHRHTHRCIHMCRNAHTYIHMYSRV